MVVMFSLNFFSLPEKLDEMLDENCVYCLDLRSYLLYSER